jgi:hypothetical protein
MDPIAVGEAKRRLEASGGGYEIVHESPGIEIGVYVLVAPEADRQQPHEDDEVYVVLEGTGTEARVPGYTVAGKTGTAAKPDAHGGYSERKYVASFVGFAPARSPRVVILVAVDEPKGNIYGGTVAAPAFARIASFALPYLEVPPDAPTVASDDSADVG